MSIETELKSHIKQNDFSMNIIEADDLIAAWCFRKNNKLKRSHDFSRVPTEYRYSAPPSEKSPVMACRVTHHSSAPLSEKSPALTCHVTHHSVRIPGTINPDPMMKYGGTVACHHSSFPDMRQVASISELEAVDFAKRNVSPYISPIMDSVVLARVTKDLGITGKVDARIINGRQYIVFGGYAGKRSLFTGTIYSKRNAKIVQMAIGSLGIQKMVLKGARITIYATVPLTIIECIINDQFTLANIVGRVTADLIKVGIGSLAGSLVGIGFGAVVTSASGPILLAILACVGTGMALQKIDEHYRLTDKLVAAIEQNMQFIAEKKEEIEKEMGRKLYEAERELIYRSCGFDIKRLTGLRH